MHNPATLGAQGRGQGANDPAGGPQSGFGGQGEGPSEEGKHKSDQANGIWRLILVGKSHET